MELGLSRDICTAKRGIELPRLGTLVATVVRGGETSNVQLNSDSHCTNISFSSQAN